VLLATDYNAMSISKRWVDSVGWQQKPVSTCAQVAGRIAGGTEPTFRYLQRYLGTYLVTYCVRGLRYRR